MANNINRFLDKAGLTRLISWIKGALNDKQDTISDLADIRSGASAGISSVPKKSTSTFYPFIGSSSAQSQWYKVTFPWSGYTSSTNTWIMTSMELVFSSGHINGNIGRIYLQYYMKKTTSNIYETLCVKGLVVGTRFKENGVFIKYELNNPGILYIRVNGSSYNAFAIENLSANDNARNFDFLQTSIESIKGSQDMPSDLEDVPLTYILMTTGTSSQFVKGDGSLDSNTYLTSYTETDPTVPAWAKASTKPNYNGSEVTTTINDLRGNFSSGDSIDEALSGISNDLTAVENAKQDVSPITNAASGALTVNEYRDFGSVSALTITLTGGTMTNYDLYKFAFVCASDSTALTLPSGVKLPVDMEMEMATGRRFECVIDYANCLTFNCWD